MKYSIFFLILSQLLYSQSMDIVGVSRSSANGGEVYLASIDPSNGLVQDISSNSYSNVIANLSYTVNPALDVFYYSDDNALIGIDMNNGALISNPTISTSIQPFYQSFIYNELTQEIVGLERGPNNGGEVYLSKINPVTGIVTPISQNSITNSITLNGGQTLDLANQWFHFVSNGRLYTIDIATGNTLYNPLIDTTTALFFDNIVYNEFDGNIYGLARNSSPAEIFLGKINPIDGTITLISQASIGQSITLAGATINPFTNTYFYKANGTFTGVDIGTGTITSNPAIDYSLSNGDFFDYYYYPNEKISLLSSTSFSSKLDFKFFPNPSIDFIYIEDNSYDKLDIMDISGRKQLSLSSKASRVNISQLPQGIYIVKAYFGKKSVVKKLIKQ